MYGIDRRRLLLAGGVLILILSIATVAWLYTRAPQMDEAMRRALANVANVNAYTQVVETETALSDRQVRITGVYHVNEEGQRFESLATTTLILPEGAERAFVLHNIAIGDDVYVKIDTQDEALRRSIPYSPLWRHFSRTAIPERFVGIATAGPILHNLSLFAEGGAHLTFVEKLGSEDRDGEELLRYRFMLSRLALSGDASLPAVAAHIGESGTIDVWIDPTSHEIRHILFENGAYRSTTKISNINAAPDILPPSADDIEA